MRLLVAGPLAALALVAALVLASCTGGNAAPGEEPALTVAAASDLALALEALRPALEEAAGGRVEFVLGSSGLLKEQVLAGAPYDLYLSADIAFAEEVVAAGRSADGEVHPYALGHLAVIVREGLPLVEALEELADERYGEISIANPTHAPYGRAAREALEAAGLWDALQPRLILGENIRQSTEYVRSGNVDAAIVALSLVAAGEAPYRLVPGDLHAPILQGAVVVDGPRQERAALLLDVILGAEGRAVLERHGFEPPDVPDGAR